MELVNKLHKYETDSNSNLLLYFLKLKGDLARQVQMKIYYRFIKTNISNEILKQQTFGIYKSGNSIYIGYIKENVFIDVLCFSSNFKLLLSQNESNYCDIIGEIKSL